VLFLHHSGIGWLDILHHELTSGLYNKPITIINSDSRVINKLETSLTDDARAVNYDRHIFIVQATDLIKEPFHSV
jgi:hypothetical protein